MTKTVKRLSLGLGTGLIALGITAGAHALAQNTNQGPDPSSGRGMMGPGGPMGRGSPMGPGGWRGPMGMLPRLAPRLGLTDPQREQIRAIAQSHRAEWQALASRAVAARQALNEAIVADTLDESLVRQRSAEVAAVEADIAVARAHAHAEVLQLLTADQKAQLKSMQSPMKNRMMGRQQARPAPRL